MESNPEPPLKRPRMEFTENVFAAQTHESDSDKGPNDKNMGQKPWNVPIDVNTKHLCFMPVDPGSEKHLEKLKEFSLREKLSKLKSIEIDLSFTKKESNDDAEEIAKILNRILNASADCLEEITLRTPIGYLPGVVFPVMKNVINLELQFYWCGSDITSFSGCLRSGEIFPKGFRFSVFPKLEDVTINLVTEGKCPQYKIVWHREKCPNTVIRCNEDCGLSK